MKGVPFVKERYSKRVPFPCKQRFFQACMVFSIYEVVRVADIRVIGLFLPLEGMNKPST